MNMHKTYNEPTLSWIMIHAVWQVLYWNNQFSAGGKLLYHSCPEKTFWIKYKWRK